MNKVVYLFELDSVIKYKNAENQKVLYTPGIKALFSEIIKNGNSVAITMNQLTDSQFIREALMDSEAYHSLLKLFKTGALKVSLYGNIRTASQYIQQSIQKCLNQNSDSFVFSNLPVSSNETALLIEIKDALQFSDLTLLSEATKEATDDEKKRYEMIYRFVNMILKLSICETSNIPPKQEASKPFEEFLNIIIDVLSCESFDDSIKEQISTAVEIIKLRSQKIVDGRQNRSNWLNTSAQDMYENLANKIIHICYNYTVEDSIRGVAKHYDDNDFENTFRKDLINRILLYCGPIETEQKFHTVSRSSWRTVTRFAEYGSVSNCKNKNPTPTTIYEKNFKKEKNSWIFFMFRKTSIALVVAFVYITVFCIINLGTSWLEDKLPFALDNLFMSSLCSVALFGILGSLIDIVLKIINRGNDFPDILENIIDMFVHFSDFLRVLGGSNDSYRLH